MLRVSLITLGVDSVPKAIRFYEEFGLTRSSAGGDGENVAFFQLGPVVLSLFGRAALSEDGKADTVWTGNGGMALAQNVRSKGGGGCADRPREGCGSENSEDAANRVLGRLSRLFLRS